jgi:sugar O-acyltransferase (sialic acid O-acetyltransferase NeuD family)
MLLGIYGAGGLGREVLDLARAINAVFEQWDKIVFINDFKKDTYINDAEVFTFEEFKNVFTNNNAKISIALGEPLVRHSLRKKLSENNYELQTLVHPTAFIGAGTQIKSGTIIQYGSFISCNVSVGINVLIQPNTSVGHDSVIGDDVVISPLVVISGTCIIGDRTYVAVSVPVKEKMSIGSDTIVGMGSVVLRDIPSSVVALGSPARVMRENTSGYVFKMKENDIKD